MLVRTPSRWAVAVRRRDGSIHTEGHGIVERWPHLRRTFLRGPLALVDAVSIGLRASDIAVRESTGAETPTGGFGLVIAPVLIGGLAVFIAAPGFVAARWTGIGADVGEALGRAAMFVLYVVLVGRSSFGRRLFAYHGAEHKTIAAFERLGGLPTLDDARRESPVHVRCGTDFIALFLIVCGVVYAFVPREPLFAGGVLRVLLVPVLAACAYELMRLAATREGALWSRIVTAPGRAFQRITTREPNDDLIDVALAALATAVG